MMRNLLKILVLTLFLSSCALKHSVINKHKYRAPADDPRYNNFLQLGVDDIEELGEVEISYEFSRNLIFWTRLIGINGEKPDNANIHYANPQATLLQTLGVGNLLDKGGLSRALYKVYIDYPDADYISVISESVQKHRMFLGVKVKKSARVKVFKFRD